MPIRENQGEGGERGHGASGGGDRPALGASLDGIGGSFQTGEKICRSRRYRRGSHGFDHFGDGVIHSMVVAAFAAPDPVDGRAES